MSGGSSFSNSFSRNTCTTRMIDDNSEVYNSSKEDNNHTGQRKVDAAMDQLPAIMIMDIMRMMITKVYTISDQSSWGKTWRRLLVCKHFLDFDLCSGRNRNTAKTTALFSFWIQSWVLQGLSGLVQVRVGFVGIVQMRMTMKTHCVFPEQCRLWVCGFGHSVWLQNEAKLINYILFTIFPKQDSVRQCNKIRLPAPEI